MRSILPVSIAPSTPIQTLEAKQLFEILVREHIDSVRAFLLASVRNSAQAEDLVQETFLTAWSNLDRYDRSLPFGPWVRGIACRLLWNHRRKLGRSKVTFLDEDDLHALEHQFERFDRVSGDTFAEKVDALKSGMRRLTPLQREVIGLHYEEGLSCAEIATRMELGCEAVKKHLQRGRAALQRELDRKLEEQALPFRREA